MLTVNSGGHTAYQDFVVTNLRKYYPDPDKIARSTRDIIEHFWNLDLPYTDDFMRDKYSVFGPEPRKGRTVHLAMKDNPRLFNIPPRDSKE